MGRKPQSAIGLSMLDLISNALGAVIILFMILSSVRAPQIPPERIKGTLFIKYEIIDNPHIKDIEPLIWVQIPPHSGNPPAPGGAESRFYGADIFRMNKENFAFGAFPDCGCKDDKTKRIKNNLTPCIVTYSPIDSPNIQYLIIRDPIKAKDTERDWETGMMYREHNQIVEGVQMGKAKISAWMFGVEGSVDTILSKTFIGTTDTIKREIKIRDFNKQLK
jgi:hypothetical protein